MNVNKKHNRRVKKLITICSLFAIVISVATYAWFIGMQTVNVSSFDINIATTEGLFLSMDGESWTYDLDVKEAPVYVGNTNTWAEEGLIPRSSIGDMDSTSSTMKLYEKGSLTAVKGGYRLLASRINNYTEKTENSGIYEESNGYVAFDLFIKNNSGREYYVENNVLNEEAIYLTTNSKVEVSASGGVAGTGIENSVRVAVAQIGRVEGTTTSTSNITKITCSNVAKAEGQAQVTGICRNAQIWEPNDTKHEQNALNYYSTSCLKRLMDDNNDTVGKDVTKAASYSGNCKTLNTTTAYPTYAIPKKVVINDNVNVYDGTAYNEYTKNSIDYADYYAEGVTDSQRAEYSLVSFPYFTDTMKDLTGTARPQFMSLAPNSITKVRVYVWIEGQDIDNYDYAALGAKISVNFGFTKERYTENDISYSGPSTDTTPTMEVTPVNATNLEAEGTKEYTITYSKLDVIPTTSTLTATFVGTHTGLTAEVSDLNTTSGTAKLTITADNTAVAGSYKVKVAVDGTAVNKFFTVTVTE